MISWKKIISRETTLLERFMKMSGYTTPLPKTRVAIKNILTVSANGLSDQYFDEKEVAQATATLYQDYDKKIHEKIFRYSFRAIKKLVALTEQMLSIDAADRKELGRLFKSYVYYYGRVRAAVLYTHLPLKKFEEKVKEKIKDVGQAKKDEIFLSLIHPATRIKGLEKFYLISETEQKKKQVYLNKFDFSEEIKNLVHYFDIRGYVHEVGERVTTMYSFPKVEKHLDRAAKKYKIAGGQISWYLPEEIVRLFNAGITVPQGQTQARKDFYVLMCHPGDRSLYVGEKAYDIVSRQLGNEEMKGKSQVIKGVIAYRGKVKGEVSILKKIAEMKNFKNGAILVASMTRPQWMPAIKKAAAIITDEGGILSHAAIISRELGIPAIIGTEIATRVLRDGDLVEVDAEQGVVKVLKRK